MAPFTAYTSKVAVARVLGDEVGRGSTLSHEVVKTYRQRSIVHRPPAAVVRLSGFMWLHSARGSSRQALNLCK